VNPGAIGHDLAASALHHGRFPLIDPSSGSPLRVDLPWSLTDGRTRWPVVEGIPYLRLGRDNLRRSVLAALDAGDDASALVQLLADQDDYATTRPPGSGEVRTLVASVDSGLATLRGAMAGLGYGPVADYFAYRWSAPTYLSGLALLGRFWFEGAAVVEVACGIGHYLRDLAAVGVPAVGVDVVFSKLWLARRYVVPGEVALLCADAALGLPMGPGSSPALAFCHDAFYFLPTKSRTAEALRGLAGGGGRVIVGHAHNRGFDHRGVAGEPLSACEYQQLFPGALLFDDAELARSYWAGSPAPPRGAADLAGVEALAVVWGASGPPDASGPESLPGLGLPRSTATTRLNPLLAESNGVLAPRWPSTRFEGEYAGESGYLSGERANGPGADAGRLARRRVLLDLPERW